MVCVGDGDHVLQFGAALVEPAAVQHGRRGHRRGRRILDGPTAAAPVGAMPPRTGGDPLDDVDVAQLDALAVQGVGEYFGEESVVVVAHAAARTQLVHDDGYGRLRRSPRGHLGQVCQVVVEGRVEVHAHHAAQLAAIEGDQDERLFGDEAQHGG